MCLKRCSQPRVDININKKAGPNKSKNANNESENNIYYINIASIVRLKSSDQIRLSRLNSLNDDTNMYEFVLYNHLEQMVEHKYYCFNFH